MRRQGGSRCRRLCPTPILEAYYLGGTDAVRELLRTNNIPDEKIDRIVAQLQHDFADLPLKSTMSKDSLRAYLNNTYVVRTGQRQDQIDAMY